MTDRGEWLQTYTGKQFFVLDPRPEDVCIEDIAHSLSLLCRFNGHCDKFYSVAQHSIFVSEIVETESPLLRLYALLHDAAEAYTGDMIRPLKKSLGPEFGAAEGRVAGAIYEALLARWGARESWTYLVKRADEVALATEKRDLVAPGVGTWKIDAPPRADRVLTAWSAEFAERVFLERYRALVDALTRAR